MLQSTEHGEQHRHENSEASHQLALSSEIPLLPANPSFVTVLTQERLTTPVQRTSGGSGSSQDRAHGQVQMGPARFVAARRAPTKWRLRTPQGALKRSAS